MADATGAATSPFRLKSFLVRSIVLGVLIALFAGPLAIYAIGLARTLSGQDIPLIPQFSPPPSFNPTTTDITLGIALMLVGAPILESLVFPPLYWLTKRLPAGKILFASLIGVSAFVAHGGAILNTAQAAGFMLMALWYAHLAERYPSPSLRSLVKIPYYGVVLTHFAWNATAILWTLSMGFILRLMTALV